MKLPRPLQVSRRSVQLFVLALTLLTPVIARYANYLSARELDHAIDRFDGSVQAVALEATDGILTFATGIEPEGVEPRGEERLALLLAARQVRGSTWSFELFGMTLTDPLAALESIAASHTVRWVMLLGIALPVLGTLLLGRVFCSWICPAGFLLELTGSARRLLRFLEVTPGRLRLWRGNKYVLLLAGLALSTIVALPLLGYIYPPALIAREIHNGVTLMFDRAEEGLLGFSAAGLTLASWFLLAIAAVELLFGPRLWCRSLCVGGAVYSLLGRWRLVRVAREAAACTSCGTCVETCQMGLSPMTDRTGMECDNCGACVSGCPEVALSFRLPGTRAASPSPRSLAPAGALDLAEETVS